MKLLFDRISAFYLKVATEPVFLKELDNTVVFINEDALERVFNDEVELEELPSFAPPYEAFFVEVGAPNFNRILDSSTEEKHKIVFQYGSRVGAWFHAYDAHKDKERPQDLQFYQIESDVQPIDPGEVRWTYGTMLFVETMRHGFHSIGEAVLYLDKLGKPVLLHRGDEIAYSYLKLNNDFIQELQKNMSPGDKTLVFDHWFDFCGMILDASMFTVGMTHCRNIGTQEFSPNASESHKFERRYGIPMNKYRVLKITGKGHDAGTLLGTGIGRQNPLHWVRAHWRTYDQEAPLFGKVTGTFYVHEFIRGDIKRGTVTKDYKVEADLNAPRNDR